MTWLAYRQFRLASLIGLGILILVAVLLAATPRAELISCANQPGCPDAATFLRMSHDHLIKIFGTLLVGVPALIGAFWGAPLVARELESGTYRLAWTQGVTRARWLATKLAVVTTAGVAMCGLWSFMLGAWSNVSIERGKILPVTFSQRGIVPIGYVVFAVALGVAVGLVLRRPIPAMAITLVVFTATRMVTQLLLRSQLLPAKHAALPIGRGLGIELEGSRTILSPPNVDVPGAWVFSRRLVDGSGHEPTAAFIKTSCSNFPVPAPPGVGHPSTGRVTNPQPFQHCLAAVQARFHETVAYQPANHFWGLQAAETGVFLAMAALVIGFSFWWIRRSP